MPGETFKRVGSRSDGNDGRSASAINPDLKIALLRQRVEHSPFWIEAYGLSMGNTIRGGARVRIVADSRPRRGRIYAFVDADGTLILHRLRRATAGRAWLRGDGNPQDDRAVSATSIVGRVDKVEGVGGTTFAIHQLVGRMRLDVDSVVRRLPVTRRGRHHDC